jgi:hypothetical protein
VQYDRRLSTLRRNIASVTAYWIGFFFKRDGAKRTFLRNDGKECKGRNIAEVRIRCENMKSNKVDSVNEIQG